MRSSLLDTEEENQLTMLRMPRISSGLVSALNPRHHMKRHIVQTPNHFYTAECREAKCPHYEFGWTTTIDEKTELGKRQGHYIRKDPRRKFIESRNYVGLTVFLFEPGQKCFQAHKLQTGEAPIKLVTAPDGRKIRQESSRWFYEANEEAYRFEEFKKRG
jgi:hypothetical protein